MKRCSKCRVERPLTDFAKDRKRRDGLQCQCKLCQREYREANKERIAAKDKAWKAANPDKVRESRQRRRSRPEVRARRARCNKEWKAKNPDKVQLQRQRAYQRDPEKYRAASRAYAAAHPEQVRQRTQEWRAQNKGRIARYRRQNRQHDRDYYARNADCIRERKEARRQWCVYRILFLDDHFYIGSSCHYDLRLNAHKSLARRGQHITALNGRDFGNASVKVLIECENEAEALEQEALAIEEAMSKHPGKCLNSTVPTKPSKYYWVYVIQSLQPRTDRKGHPRPGFFYVGMTTDPARRLRAHNGEIKGGGKYTSKHRPWEARALHGPYHSRSEALRAEYALKRQKRGTGRLKWSTSDSPLCRGEGVSHPWVSDPAGWKPPLPE